jgi:hypothetical protein
VPSTSMRSIDGACASRLGAFAPSACAIGPLRWAWRPASSAKASNAESGRAELQGEPYRGGSFLPRQVEAVVQEPGEFLLLAGLGFEADKQCTLDRAWTCVTQCANCITGVLPTLGSKSGMTLGA